jgi:hypothetical protein
VGTGWVAEDSGGVTGSRKAQVRTVAERIHARHADGRRRFRQRRQFVNVAETDSHLVEEEDQNDDANQEEKEAEDGEVGHMNLNRTWEDLRR